MDGREGPLQQELHVHGFPVTSSAGQCRILHLEDSVVDAEMIIERLRMDGFTPEVERVETGPAFTEALSRSEAAFDLILADLALPEFDGITALAIARRLSPSIPFIFVSGTLGEDEAIEAVKAGATDYVVKQRLRRLPATIRRALAEAQERAERRAAEAELGKSEARLARLLATTPVGVIELDPEGHFAYANAAAERILGAEPGGLANRHYADPAWQVTAADGTLVPSEYRPSAWALGGETITNHEYVLTTLDGRRTTLLVDAVPVRGSPCDAQPRGPVLGALAAFQDVTTRHAQAQALRESEERYRTLFEAVDVGFCIVEMRFDEVLYPVDYRFIEVNPAFERHTGLADATGRWMRDLSPAHEQHWFDVFGSVALTGKAVRFENSAERRGRYYDVHAFRVGNPAGYRVAILFNDITARRHTEMQLRESEAALRSLTEALEARVAERTADLMVIETQLRQSQKMEAVGQLTGGIAHDFNNMLQAIGANLELLGRRLTQGRVAEAARFATGARETVERAAALTHRLLAFARRQVLQPKAVDPDELIQGMAELIRQTAGPGVAVELRRGDGIWTVLCDPSQLENALLNLAINARDAMIGSGTLTIGIEDVRLSEADVAGQEGARPGDYVEVVVIDNGSGMDEATRLHAFEPFFTTKPLGQGTGLGLSQVYGFVRQSSGVVRLDSAPGRGTAVRLYLPRNEQAWERPGFQLAPAAPAAEGAGGTVLLVEDEDIVRAVAAEHLRELGYAVLEACDGPQALLTLRSVAHLDLLVTDVGLPGGLNGRQVADAARERRPTLPVLFITGYAGSTIESALPPGMMVISKPFALDTLAERVRAMLEPASAPWSASPRVDRAGDPI